MIEISGLFIYPVKSLHGIALSSARLGIRGLDYDRNWVITDCNGHFVTQREIPQMATIQVALVGGNLQLTHGTQSPLEIDLEARTQTSVEVTVWKDRCRALDEGEIASNWLTHALGRWNDSALRLSRLDPTFIRPVDRNYLRGEESHTAFADGFPFLITSEESLAHLNTELQKNGAKPVPMSRFRPNIVIRGVSAFQEDSLLSVSVVGNRYQLGIRKPCKRCPITTIDQDTGEKPEPKEPLRTLAGLKTQPQLQGAFFGQNATLLRGETEIIAVGDSLCVERRTTR